MAGESSVTTLHTASFYDPQDWLGQRVRVSRQHPRGLTTQWDTLPGAYPDADTVHAFRAGAITADEFASRYERLLDERYEENGAFRAWVDSLPDIGGDVTLLCFERGERFCHRRVLAEWLLRRAGGRVRRGMLR